VLGGRVGQCLCLQALSMYEVCTVTINREFGGAKHPYTKPVISLAPCTCCCCPPNTEPRVNPEGFGCAAVHMHAGCTALPIQLCLNTDKTQDATHDKTRSHAKIEHNSTG